MSRMIEVIAAHRAAWQAFQDAPDEEKHPDTISASLDEAAAMMDLLRTVPEDQADLSALKAHLDWWVVKEEQREGFETELFALHAVIELATHRIAEKAKALLDAVEFDNNGAMVAGKWVGGNGGLIGHDTIRAADDLRKTLGEVKL